jgi:hypothetical protein
MASDSFRFPPVAHFVSINGTNIQCWVEEISQKKLCKPTIIFKVVHFRGNKSIRTSIPYVKLHCMNTAYSSN